MVSKILTGVMVLLVVAAGGMAYMRMAGGGSCPFGDGSTAGEHKHDAATHAARTDTTNPMMKAAGDSCCPVQGEVETTKQAAGATCPVTGAAMVKTAGETCPAGKTCDGDTAGECDKVGECDKADECAECEKNHAAPAIQGAESAQAVN